MKTRYLVCALFLIGSPFLQAEGLDFTFSFPLNGYSGTAPDPALDGTISGEIIGLQDNNPDTIPTEVLIDTAPLAYGLTLPYTFEQSEISPESSLSVSNGVLSENGSFYLSNSTGTVELLFNLSGGDELITPNGFGGSSNSEITFAPISAPKPSSWTLTLVGAIGVVAFLLKRKRRGAPVHS